METGLGWAGIELQEFDAALNPFNEPFDWNAEATVQAIIPAANGQFTARSLARIYANALRLRLRGVPSHRHPVRGQASA